LWTVPAAVVAAALILVCGQVQIARGQSFDFARLQSVVRDYTVVLKVKVEISFGMQTNEQEVRLLGTVVSPEGLILFDGTTVSSEQHGSMSGMSFRVTPVNIEVTTLQGKKYKAELVGIDRFTQLGFARITDAGGTRFASVQFSMNQQFKIGSWLAAYMLLPEFVTPPVAADIGMISSLIDSPEKFPLTVGFGGLEMASVLYDERLTPVGVLGALMDPSSASTDAGGMISGSGEGDVQLLGVVTGERIQKLIASPPKKGEDERSWLGITLQALTKDIGEFLNIGASGGIIVTDVVKGSPAAKSGMAVGDVIHEINGQPVEVDMEEKVPIFQRRIAEMAPGTQVEFSVLRPHDQKVDTLRVVATLEKAPLTAANAPTYESKDFEFKVRNIVFSDYIQNNLDVGSLTGVVVSDLKQSGLADVGGLELGDVIQRIGSNSITSIDDVQAVMTKITTDKPREVVFFVWRNNKTMFVNVKTDWKLQ
jgi:serine protease Do